MVLTGARLTGPVQRYKTAKVIGPHVRHWGGQVFATTGSALTGLLARRLARRLPPETAARLRRERLGGDMVLGAFPEPADLRWCARAVQNHAPDAVLIDTIFRAPLLAEPELHGVRSIIIAHDVFHRRAQAMAAAGYSVQPRDFTRAFEAVLLGRADAIAAIQPEEADVIRAMCPEKEVFTTAMPALPCQPPITPRLAGRLVFVGSAALPNLDGLRWFMSDIWPLLAGSGISLDILGECGPALRGLPPGVHVRGRVDNLTPYLHRAALAIAPLRAGSGLKLKLLDYARHGLTTIATPPALAGFAPDPRSPFIAAGSAAMFAEAVRRLADNPPPSDAALAYCRTHYGEAASFAGLGAALRAGPQFSARPRSGVLGH